MYKIQRTLPNKGNKFYNNGDNGGYSWCITGKPTVDGLNVLDNCVGWACARFNEIYSIETGHTGMKYPQFCCNAERFYGKAQELGLEIRKEPTNGGIMVWEGKGDLAGHVAVVERVNGDGTVLTSESGYNHFAFENHTRNNSNGNWGVNNHYIYLGCIVNPANPKPEDEQPQITDGYPFEGIVKKGSQLYNEDGFKYPCDCKANRICTVEGEKDGRYKIYCSDFNPKTVYTNKENISKRYSDYQFPATIKKGSQLYDANGNAYNKTLTDKRVIVQCEVNGRYAVYNEYFRPNIVYCDKDAIIK